jgi:hypothetical protein
MSIARVTELSATSETSFEDGHQRGRRPCHQDAQGRRGRVGQGYERQHRGREHQGLQDQPGGNFPAGGSLLEQLPNLMPVA